jgi:hypothetical protein
MGKGDGKKSDKPKQTILCGRNANHVGVGMSPVSKRRSNNRYGVPGLYT